MSSGAMFLTYDGLLDPLGSSQILPYVLGIARQPRPVHIVSFEKMDRFDAGADRLREQLSRQGIEWTPLSFTTRFGKLGKGWDLLRMYCTAIQLQLRKKFRVIHCRSYQAMQVGCLLSRMTGATTIFDMRGLWVDERIDGGLWSPSKWTDRLAYRLYKYIERHLLASASHVVVLTNRVAPELSRLSPDVDLSITVIPCCADFDHFRIASPDARQSVRAEIGVGSGALLISYLGSLGTWYMLDEMLQFFSAAAGRWDEVHLLFITKDWRAEHEARVELMGLAPARRRIHVRSATRDQVPALLGASDVMLSFIKPAYSKIASSPTKFAEALALGVPVISNVGIGDVEQITRELDAGGVFDLADPAAMAQVVEDLDLICQKGGKRLRDRARPKLGLEVAARAYRDVYRSVERMI
jgi:hypothetical protein